MEEQWKDFYGYKVSNTGRVINPKTGCEFKQTRNHKGYMTVTIKTPEHNNKGWGYLVHRVVAKLFVENPDPEHFNQVNHKDENPGNNNADNLEWCDNYYNTHYGNGERRRAAWKRYSEICSATYGKRVRITKGNETRMFDSIAQAERFLYGKSNNQIEKKFYWTRSGWMVEVLG